MLSLHLFPRTIFQVLFPQYWLKNYSPTLCFKGKSVLDDSIYGLPSFFYIIQALNLKNKRKAHTKIQKNISEESSVLVFFFLSANRRFMFRRYTTFCFHSFKPDCYSNIIYRIYRSLYVYGRSLRGWLNFIKSALFKLWFCLWTKLLFWFFLPWRDHVHAV